MNTKTRYILKITEEIRETSSLTELKNIILAFVLLKRLDCILEFSKQEVLKCYSQNKQSSNLNQYLIETSVDESGNKLGYYNYSKLNLNLIMKTEKNLEENLIEYIFCFSDNIRDIFEKFNIDNEIKKLSKKGLLTKILEYLFSENLDLSTESISNREMGAIYDELIQFFPEHGLIKSGMIYTPQYVSKLMGSILFIDGNNDKTKTIYDPACGCGRLLTCCEEFLDDDLNIIFYGQDIDPLAYALCKSSLLIKGKSFENIKGPSSTLSDDQFPKQHFDYIISEPPWGSNWKMDEDYVYKEYKKGFEGRFGAGLPRKRDSQLLFLLHMISKMNLNKKSRIAVITAEPPLSFGDIGTGESDIRKWIFESDYLESIIALPRNLFYGTSIPAYILILTNEKIEKRKNKVQLINLGNENFNLIEKSQNKKHIITDESIDNVLKIYNSFEETENTKILDNDDFGFKRIIVERPMQRNYRVSRERLENLHSFFSFERHAVSKNKNIKILEKEKKEEKIKEALLTIDDGLYTNRTVFEEKVQKALSGFNLNSNILDNIVNALSEHDENVDFELTENGEIKADPNLREIKKIPLKENMEEYLKQIKTNYPNAWIDYENIKIGYEVNFSHLNYDEKLFFDDVEYPIYKLDNLIKLTYKITNENDLYIKTIISPNTKKIAYYPHELSDEKLNRTNLYIGCELRNNQILKEYLFYYLNSNKGLDHLNYFQRTLNLNKNALAQLPIPVPDINTQNKIVETYRLMESFFNEMDIWKKNYLNNILNYEATLKSYKEFSCSIKFGEDGGVSDFCHNWRIVYQGLIWPLAYAYLKATKGSKYEGTIKHNYLVLFEFLAAFNVIVLISAIKESDISSDDLNNIQMDLWQLYHNNRKTWHNMHFGGWTTLYWRLTKIYKNKLYEFNTKINKEFFNKLSNARYQNLFNELRDRERNPDAHGGLEDDIDTETKLDDLKIYMDTEIFNILSLYSGLKLYYITDEIKKITPEKISHNVMSLNGPCDPPNWHTITSHEELKPHSLYLYDSLDNAYLKIDDDLIKFGLIPNTKQYGIYIYDGVDSKENVAIYKCYHHKNEIMKITLNTEEDTYFKVSAEFLEKVLKINR